MFKALVGTACIAVIAFVGYFFFQQWNEGRIINERASREAEIEQAVRCTTALGNWKYFQERGYSMVSNDPEGLLQEAVGCGHAATDDDRRKIQAALDAAGAPIPALK